MQGKPDISAPAIGMTELSKEQSRLVEEKMAVLQRARDLQSQLATARIELTRIDASMLQAGFKIPILACW